MTASTTGRWLTIVGIGEDGLEGLSLRARAAIAQAEIVYGGARHLAFVPERRDQERVAWPSPLMTALPGLIERRGRAVCVLASGDPMFHGIGATLARHVPPDETLVLPAPSSVSLAAARLGWPLADIPCVTVHGRPLARVLPTIQPGARLFVLSESGATPAALAALLTAHGFGPSILHVLEHLGGPRERRRTNTAEAWGDAPVADLNLIGIEVVASAGTRLLPVVPGLPDDAFTHDGQLTKRDLRAMVLARLGPVPDALLWDIGAGSGSIGIEWMRGHPRCLAIAIEAKAERQALIARNREALGTPGLRIVAGRAPDALAGLDAPDAVFIGGGVTEPGVIETAWQALRPGGRLVANAVTVQSEGVLARWRERTGGDLIRVALAQAHPLGRFDTWRPALPVTMLAATKRLA
ncbi:precorrin-6y C5,15-methyltransferase (decarboxylating) subunit CbiE [Marinivivus vitaminiproducens]|uniref:precorrin-6y C5,15-methyltransferase (decarboxylating) subunit CbiE n=1 Tax=Marinivivus vitaminiproducens TaxID=3035935 RepID=UPI00279E1DDC|nr:precorrin-6y C5,15-methyltransferase (decarboxylating) subunit CbiE [Geminicoccaceae bacterium SCSIO 64248]